MGRSASGRGRLDEARTPTRRVGTLVVVTNRCRFFTPTAPRAALGRNQVGQAFQPDATPQRLTGNALRAPCAQRSDAFSAPGALDWHLPRVRIPEGRRDAQGNRGRDGQQADEQQTKTTSQIGVLRLARLGRKPNGDRQHRDKAKQQNAQDGAGGDQQQDRDDQGQWQRQHNLGKRQQHVEQGDRDQKRTQAVLMPP